MTLYLWLAPTPGADLRGAARGLFAQGLFELYGLEQTPEWALGAQGKPFLPTRPDICFNISHCPAGAVCGFDAQELGVDLQDMRPLRPALIQRVLSPAEAALLAQTRGERQRERLFARFWSRKEAELKRLGTGIDGKLALTALDTLSLPNLTSFDFPQAVLSAAGENAHAARIVLVGQPWPPFVPFSE